MTKPTYYVLDGEGNTVWHGRDNDDCPQKFKSFAAAEKRAQAYADSEPGVEIKIARVEAVVLCPVMPAKTHKV